MAKRYKAKINYVGEKNGGSVKKSPSRVELARTNSPRAKALARKSPIGLPLLKFSKSTKENFKKAGLVFLGAILIAATVAGIWLFAWIQELDSKIPSAESPFGNKEAASIIYDRNGQELYRVFNEYNRDPVNIEEIPAQLKWAFLAAEDVDFYTHTGFDIIAIARCAVLNISSGVTVCGGSTVTQQTAKLTSFSSDVTLKRKIEELLLAMKIEQSFTKDEILELYLTVSGFGGNVYGVTTAAKVYFNKNVKDLTLAEAALIAGIPQNPVYNSPTLAPDPAQGKIKAVKRQQYILDQLLEKKDKINAQHRININNPDAPDLITEEMITAARTEEMKYAKPRFGNKPIAGHFIDYVTDMLQQRNYKNGEEVFKIAELQNGGYKIYTTLDRDIQKIAESATRNGLKDYGQGVGATNAAMVTIKPDSGEVLAMVGSKNYNGTDEGCNSKQQECDFNPQVNIINSRQSPGSSTKPMGYYEAYRQGLIFTGSSLPDIPIEVPGYSLKNWNGQISGPSTANYASDVLKRSLNLPAVIVINMIGVESFLNVMRDFGYTTYNDTSQFGASVILGGADIIPIEHVQGYGVFANGGDFVQHEVVKKIEDRDGNLVYEHKPKRERVADPRAVYLLNESLVNNYNMATSYWEGHDLADKTGTSENNRDIQLMAYSPDIVTYGWMGRNNNKPMSNRAFGANVTPWIGNYLVQIRGSKYFSKKRDFAQPSGVVRGGGCGGSCEGENVGLVSGWMLADKDYSVDNIRKTVEVCKDQPTRLARDIDRQLGLAERRTVVRWQLPTETLQRQLDAFVKSKFKVSNTIPKDPCTKDRSGGATGPWFYTGTTSSSEVAVNKVRFRGYVGTGSGTITNLRAYVDFDGSSGEFIGDIAVTAGSFDATIDVPPAVQALLESGRYSVGLIATNSNAETKAIKLGVLTVESTTTSNMDLTIIPNPPTHTIGSNINFNMIYSGAGTPTNVRLIIFRNGTQYQTQNFGGPGYTLNWSPTQDGTYTFAITANVGRTGALTTVSPIPGKTVTVVP